MRLVSSRASKLLAAAALASLLAACQSGRTQVASLEGYTPDPALKTASKSNLKGRVSHACVITQARSQKVPEASVEQPCGCYADRTLSTLDSGEIQSYRATGYFNESAKAKALNALDSCKLPRPA
ncbi:MULTISPECIES: hypothetical protein [Methylobacterium]|uniref:Lipoprotein n=1 Tax=Methylobacterium thuringiense TaxID=1003091 RepID=A0ABQ4TH41_9HYPH|nr:MULTISPECIES: hypothetical protein [Methylobacterium]TXN24871.1 hypothetical protein FV217_01625 [Methylobacterium sp. WL9]GJE54326.1 hypothetical protein EKPJFOCH_0800 [Methylobacterium thuringiense]